MKLDKLKELFDEQVATKMWGAVGFDDKAQDELVGNAFLQGKDFIVLVLDRIKQGISGANSATYRQLLIKIKKNQSFRQYASDPTVPKVEIPLPPKREHGEFGSFPEQLKLLSEMETRAAELRANDLAESLRVMNMVKSDALHDPRMPKADDVPPPGAEGKFWDDVNTPFQDFILGACPRNDQEVAAIFKRFIDENHHLLVSLLQSFEVPSNRRVTDFWKNERLASLIPGWTFKVREEKELDSRPIEREGQRPPRVVETTIEATNGVVTRIFTHLHLDGWPDQSPMPWGEELFHVLQMRIAQLCTGPRDRIWINCLGGVGRSGSTAVARYIKQMIDAEVTRGTRLDQIKINIPEIIYAFRKQRPELVGQPSHLAHLHAWVGRYYKELRIRQTAVQAMVPASASTS